jgi:flagellar basal body-associated protein FliL
MKAKTAILISSTVLVAGAATWFFWFRKRNTVSEEDRARLQQIEPVLADFDYERNATQRPESIINP